MKRPLNSKIYLQIILSVFLLYHCLAILILPNSDSILSRQLSPWFTPYANALGLNTTWRFFSPEPTPAVYFIYDADMTEGEAAVPGQNFWHDRGFVTGRWPPEQPQGMWRENAKRLVYHSRFTTVSEERVKRFFGPLLCRFYPKATNVSVRAVAVDMPSIESWVIHPQAFVDAGRERDIGNYAFSCETSAP